MVIGAILLTVSQAATPYASSEAESGTLSGSAAKQSNTIASSGSNVLFGSTHTVSGVPAGIMLGSTYEGAFNQMTTAQQQAAVALMKSDGAKWTRVDIVTTYASDSIIRDAEADGINVIGIIQDTGIADTPQAISAFAAQATAHADALGVNTYEILNEPNCTTMTAASYTAILQASYTAVKSVNANATVLTAGLCPAGGNDEPYTYLQAMYADGAGGYFDALNLHPYSFPDTPLQTTDSWNPWSYIPQLHSIMAANGDGNKQIWLTEFGCPTGTDGGYPADCTDATEAQQITDAFSVARSYNYIGPLLIDDWRDDNQNGDGDFGLYDANNNPKPASLAAYLQAAAE